MRPGTTASVCSAQLPPRAGVGAGGSAVARGSTGGRAGSGTGGPQGRPLLGPVPASPGAGAGAGSPDERCGLSVLCLCLQVAGLEAAGSGFRTRPGDLACGGRCAGRSPAPPRRGSPRCRVCGPGAGEPQLAGCAGGPGPSGNPSAPGSQSRWRSGPVPCALGRRAALLLTSTRARPLFFLHVSLLL